jgi:hypothetical protein
VITALSSVSAVAPFDSAQSFPHKMERAYIVLPENGLPSALTSTLDVRLGSASACGNRKRRWYHSPGPDQGLGEYCFSVSHKWTTSGMSPRVGPANGKFRFSSSVCRVSARSAAAWGKVVDVRARDLHQLGLAEHRQIMRRVDHFFALAPSMPPSTPAKNRSPMAGGGDPQWPAEAYVSTETIVKL